MDCGLGGMPKIGLARSHRIDGVEIKVQLRDDADIGPALRLIGMRRSIPN